MTNEENDALQQIEQEKLKMESEQIFHSQNIVELDEAAGSAEGMDNRSDNIHEEVKEDRDATPPEALDIPPSNIIS